MKAANSFFWNPDEDCDAAVEVIGDNLAVKAVPNLEEALPNATISAERGMSWSDGLNALSGGTDANILVWLLGTDDADLSENDINSLHTAVGPNVQVLIMSLYDPKNPDANDLIHGSVERFDNFHLLDWASIANSDFYGLFGRLNDEGAEALTNMISSAVEEQEANIQNFCYSRFNNCAPNGSTIAPSAIGGAGYGKLKWAVQEYGEFAMEMQRKYGVPWEVVFAQMQVESSVGSSGIALSASNNWLGITGSGDAGTYTSSSGRNWAMFTSIEASIEAWAGRKVLRNGYYDAAFQYLDPNNYNMEAFLREMIHHYAPNSDGNNEAQYVANVLGLLDGPIKEVREENGWKSSAELAKDENITPGGQTPIGSRVAPTASSSSSSFSGPCLSSFSGSNAAIANLAIKLAWPDDNHHNMVKPEFADAASALGESASLSWSQDCGHFVGVVVRTAADSSFPASGSSSQLAYLRASPKWTEIPNTNNTAVLQAGDVLALDGHILIYIGNGRRANASKEDFTGRIANGIPLTDWRGKYHIFRFKG